MQITIKLFANFRENRFKEARRDYPSGTTIGDVATGLDIEHGTGVCQHPGNCVVVSRIAVQNHGDFFDSLIGHAFTSGCAALIFFTRLIVLAA